MGFYLRKSVSVGPFRFNLSKSGVGVSAGIKGLRVGTGPRGNYISVGRGGLYYRATISTAQLVTVPATPPTSPPTPLPNTIPQPGLGPMVAIESAPISAMQDTSSAELLSELNSKANRPNYWKWTAAGSLLALVRLLNRTRMDCISLHCGVDWAYVLHSHERHRRESFGAVLRVGHGERERVRIHARGISNASGMSKGVAH
jgi:hypothetical protein